VAGVVDPRALTGGFELEYIDGATWRPIPPDALIGKMRPDELMARMLLLVAHTAEEVIPVGTGFVISGEGRFVTAEHVASELKGLVRGVHGEPVAVKALILSTAHGGAVPVRKLWTNPEDDDQTDITVGILSLPANEPLLPAFEVASKQLARGERVLVLGCASISETDSDVESTFSLYAEFMGVLTTVREVHADGYSIVPGPVFEMDAHMGPGMSGGPIIRLDTGQVVGICSSGSDLDQDPYCVGSILRPENLQRVIWR
jgi:S1-C subfamily serine protease